MADVTGYKPNVVAAGNPVPLRFVDNGDGTYSEFVSVGATITLDPTNLATGAKQDTGNASVGNVDTNLGAKADSAASSDAGTFSLIALVKRGLQSLTSLVTSLALLEPAARCAAVTPNDGADLANNTRALMVSVAGDVKVDFVTTGTGIVLTDLQPGIAYPFRIRRVYSTGTTASGVLALW